MKIRHIPTISRLLSLAAVIIVLSGFSFSDPHKLTQEIKGEIKTKLQKIAEKTPSARLRSEWRIRRDAASSSLEKAEMAQASRYCPAKWDEAVALFKKAKYYASRRSYRKAVFLAKEAKKKAEEAYTASSAIILGQETSLKKQYKKLRARADELAGSIPPDAEELSARASMISLALEDARLAIELMQFDEARKELPDIKTKLDRFDKLVRDYKKAHPPPDDDEEP